MSWPFQKSKKRVAIFIGGHVLSYSPSMLNVIEFLAGRYRLDLYSVCPIKNVPLNNSSNISRKRLVEQLISFQFLLQRIAEFTKKLTGFKSRVPVLSARQLARLAFDFVLYPLKKININLKNYSCILAFDPGAYMLANRLLQSKSMYLYSLELYLPEDNNVPPGFTTLDFGGLKGLIIQSPQRDSLFRKAFNIPDETPTLLLPVTYCGPPEASKTDVLRKKFSIDISNKVAIYIGGFHEENDIHGLIEQFSMLNSWVLVIQGYSNEFYLNNLIQFIQDQKIGNVYISDTFYEKPDDIKELVSSADIGIAWYKNLNSNMETAGFSSGKISYYLKCGLPVIANNYQSFTDAVSSVGAGECIAALDDLPTALDKIMADYNNHSVMATHQYETKYRFELYQESLLSFLEI